MSYDAPRGNTPRPARIGSLLLALAVVLGLINAPQLQAQAATQGEIPQQEQGSAAGRSHEASTEDTSAEDDSGGKPHNALPAEGLPSDERPPAPELPQQLPEKAKVSIGSEPDADTRGFDPDTSRELKSERSSQSQTFANADGTRTLRVYQSQKFAETADGDLRPVDLTLERDGSGWRTTTDSRTKNFADAANTSEIASVELADGRSLGFRVADAADVTAKVSGSSVTYPDIRPRADLNLRATAVGIKETIRLKSADAPTVWDFPMNVGDLTPELHEGSVLLKDSEGEVRHVIPPGYMVDSNIHPRSGEGVRSDGVKYEIVGDAEQPVLRVSVDEEWLADPERVFPVKVDPSVVGKDTDGTTYVQSPYDSDYSGEPNMSVGTYNGGGNKAAAFLKFDSISSELAGNYVLGARLRMFETWSYSCDPRPVRVHEVTQPWSVQGSKSYPGPATGAEIARKSFAHGYNDSCGSQWVDIPLGNAGRDLVHGWTHGEPNHGLALRASETDSKGWKKFASAASANPPYLEVTYTPYWADYELGGMSPVVTTSDDGRMSVTVTNRGRDTWTPDNDYKLGYRLWDAEGNELPRTSTAWTDMPHDVAPGQTVTLDARVEKLPPGEYSLRWDMDHYGTSRFSSTGAPMSASVAFTVPNQPPAVDSMSPPSDYNASVLTPTLALTGHDQDAYPGEGINYRFKVCSAPGEDCFNSGWVDSPVWSVPEGELTWGENYVWYGQIGDMRIASPWTQGSHLTTKVPQPPVTSHLSSGDEVGGRVDPGVGNFAEVETDAEIAAVGPELSVARSYNSLDPRRNPAFGSGWSTKWDARVVPDDDGSGNVVVTYASGQQARYGRNPDGSYATPSGRTATLVRTESDGWTLRTQGGQRYEFDSGGRLTRIVDAQGREQHLSYDGSGNLATVTDATSGRSLHLTFSDGHVTEISTAPDPVLTWYYHYDGDRLTRVCDPTGACDNYTYTDSSHYRAVTLDANPRAYWRLSEQSGTAVTSEVPGYWESKEATSHNLTHGRPGPIAGGSTTAAGFDGSSSYVQLPDDMVRNSQYLAVEMWFKTSSSNGEMLFSTGYDRPGTSNPSDAAMPALYVGTDGKLHGHFWNGKTAGIASGSAVNDGEWHHVVLSGARDTQTLFLDGRTVGSQSGKIDNVDPLNHVGAGWFNSRDWPAAPNATWDYFDGDIAEVAMYHQPMGRTVAAEHYEARTATEQLTSIKRAGGAYAAEVSYDSSTARVTSYTDSDGGTWQVGESTTEGDGFRYGEAVTGSRPNAHWRLRENEGTTARSDPALRRAEYHSVSRTSGPIPDTAARSFDGQSSYVQLPDDTLTGRKRLAVELWFKTSSTDGGVLFSTGNNRPDDENPTGGAMPVLYVGTDGKLHGHFWNAKTEGAVSANKVNDGQWHQVMLSGKPEQQTLYLDGSAVQTLQGELQNVDPYGYVGTGLLNGLNWPAKPEGTWGHFEGSIGQVALYPYGVSASDAQEHYAARGDAADYRAAVREENVHTLWTLGDPAGSTHAESVHALTDATYHGVDKGVSPPMRGSGAVGFDGQSSYVRLPNSQARGRSRLSVEMWFKTSSSAGGVLYSTGNQAPSVTDPPGGAMPVLYVGTDGKLRGHFWNDKVSGITTDSAVNDGEWHHVALSAAGDSQRLYLDGDMVGSQSGELDNRDRYDFLGVGQLDSNDWPALPDQVWNHFQGSIGEVALYHRPLDSASVADHYSARNAATAVDITGPDGGVRTYTYDPNAGGRTISVTNSDGATKVYGYDTGGFVNRITDANGNTTRISNDERGNQLSRTQCRTDGTEKCYTSYRSYYHNPDDPLDPRNGKVTEFRDARSGSETDDTYLTTYSYNAAGKLTSTSEPGETGGAQRTTTNTYTTGDEPAPDGGTQPPGLLASETDPAGNETSHTYTSAGDLASVTDPAGLVTEYDYDGLGRKTSETQVSDSEPDGLTTTFDYDQASRLVEKVGPETENAVTGELHQRRVRNTYNGDGSIAETTVDDALGNDPARTTSYTYDNRGRRLEVTGPEGGVTRTEYDEFGEVVRRVTPAGTEYTYSYTDARHQLATMTVTGFSGDGSEPHDVVLESRAYDPAGRLASVTDAMGRTTTRTYYDDGQLAAERLLDYQDPETGKTRDLLLRSYEYLGNGSESLVVRGDGQYSTSTEYDPAGRPVRSTDHEGEQVLRSTETSYDAVGNPIEVIDRNPQGEIVRHAESSYDPMGRRLSNTVHTGGETLVSKSNRDQRGLVTSTVDPRGTAQGADAAEFTTEYGYDALGRRVTVTQPQVRAESGGNPAEPVSPVVTNGYNTFGETVARRGPNGNVTTSAYDKAGRQVSTTKPDYTPPGASEPITATSTTSYDAAGRVVKSTDALGNTTTFGYDELGNLVRRTNPAREGEQSGGVWRATYDPLGERLSVTDVTGAEQHYTYDKLGRTITSTVVERVPEPTRNLTTRYTYDALGNPASVSTPTGLTTTYEHDDLGNPVSMTDPAGNTTTSVYNAQGKPVSITEPSGVTTTYEYDLAGRLLRTADLDAAGNEVRSRGFGYDRAGNQVSSTDAHGVTTTRSFDPLNRLRSITRPVADGEEITTSYGYDAAGNVTRATDGNGNNTVYTVNSWNTTESTIEPATERHPDAADRTYTTAYDALGRVKREIQPGGVTVSKSYDALGNLVGESGSGAEASTPDRSFGYDKAGRMTSATVSGKTNTFGYDDRGNLVSAAGPSGDSTFAYDDEGRISTTTTAAGEASFGYDAAGRLATAVDPLTGITATYGYDDAGRRAQVEYGGQGTYREYGYDELSRLSSDTVHRADDSVSTELSYDYDVADRLISKQNSTASATTTSNYTYDKAGRLTSWDNGDQVTQYSWDAAGNLVGSGGETATYDERNRLLSRGGTEFEYSARGTVTARSAGGTTTDVRFNAYGEMTEDGGKSYGYDALNRLVSSGSRSLSYAGDSLKVTSDGQSEYSYTPEGGALGVFSGGSAGIAVTNQHTDLVGTVSPGDGSVSGWRSYSPFGQVSEQEGSQPSLGYQGQFTDSDSGKVNMGSRWYRPGTGTFTSRDTANLDPTSTTDANRYAYAGGNPLTRIDPRGYFWGSVVDVVKEVSGYNDAKRCMQGSWAGCAWTAANFTPFGKIAKGVKTAYKGYKTWSRGRKTGKAVDDVPSSGRKFNRGGGKAKSKAKSRGRGRAGTRVGKTVGHVGGRVAVSAGGSAAGSTMSRAAIAQAREAAREAARLAARRKRVRDDAMTHHPKPKPSNTVSKQVQNRLNRLDNQEPIELGVLAADAASAGSEEDAGGFVPDALGAVGGLRRGGGMSRPGATPDLPGGGSARSSGSGGSSGAGGSCTPNSFVPGTEVVLADGSRVAIEEVELGDRVLATDPESGETEPRRVTATITGQGQKHLVEVTVDTDGDRGSATDSVTATGEHPFWVPNRDEWVDAEDLQAGDRVRTAEGEQRLVTGIRTWTALQRVHNLTINDTHTYYVDLNGHDETLVHNVKCGANGGWHGALQPAGDGKEINHIPAKTASPLKNHSGPAIRMDIDDHRALYSTGGSLPSQAWHMRQKELIDAGDFRGAMQMDVDDIRARFGSKYDEAIREMWVSLSSNKALRRWASSLPRS
ncbi:intein N-terminal splicing region/RHS repeat-associated core domain-containing protein [Actinopolyspora mzabensis]|uniref:Intein N-terminal splicing region/RHS repeat-associated core domain-containing protein n=1 Tax=Actinopolyspora mzabensis TaxID=995066 RepID=A0A1G8W260_ACTMZ|nr:LamG-like jellyroll fold domain-containing protein [Actinopolyspora mzabensis]SDJ72408.1 intein N-terminal splicing region/RHS repeat-associated core domain-containing protein [Actinopolyspora mzabensis]